MATLRIYDLKQHALTFDLRDLVELLAPRSLQATWTVSTVKSSERSDQLFEATGEGGEKLEALAKEDAELSGPELARLARETHQVIWGQFVGAFPSKSRDRWITIRAVDSTYYEITTIDEAVLNKIKSAFNDVRHADVPIA